MDVKEAFYAMIDHIGKDSIKRMIAEKPSDVINMLISEFNRYLLSKEYSEREDNIALVTTLMHYMLTECMIPSERKVTVDGVMLDIVIPTTRLLGINPSNVLVITILDDPNKVRLAECIQQNKENIWLILPNKDYTIEVLDRLKGYRIYAIDNYINQLPIQALRLSSIIDDIRKFLRERGIKSLNILHI